MMHPAYSVFIANCANTGILIKTVCVVFVQLLKVLLTDSQYFVHCNKYVINK